MNPSTPAALLALGLVVGCSAGGSSRSLTVGSVGTGGAKGIGHGTGGGTVLLGGDASVSAALSAHVESPRGVTVDFVTVSCSNQCADVLAVASGGFQPYTFTWEDGSTDPARHVCPTTTTEYRVSVTDTGISSPEFARPPSTASAALTANVIQCPDGGTVEPIDAGATGPTAPPVYWATWSAMALGNPGSAQGTLSPPGGDVQVAFAGQVGASSAKTGDATLSFVGPVLFLPESTYTSPTIPNPPPQTGMITLWDATTATQTITFASPVRDPLVALVALRETWVFDSTPTILSSGPNALPVIVPEPMSLTVTGNDLVGQNGNGVLVLRGTFTSLHFTVPKATTGDFTGFTVGIRGRG